MSSQQGQTTERFYEVTPMLPHFGGEVRGFSLAGDEPFPDEFIRQLKEDMKQYRVLIFRGQGPISGARQVQLSEQLGRIDSTFYKHPASPHPDIFRVSNDAEEGCPNVGRTGWHIDGTFRTMPFKYQTMHFHAVCEGGETWFIPLKEFYEMQDEQTREQWDKLWMVVGGEQFAHPLVYEHPVRRDTTMMFHCGPSFCSSWVETEHLADPYKRIHPRVIQAELTKRLDEAVDKIGIKMQWDVGDFAINDNLGNCHYAAPGTQNKRAKAGLRILHRTTVAGDTVPTKADGRTTVAVEADRFG